MIPVKEARPVSENYAGTVILNRLKGIEVNEIRRPAPTRRRSASGISRFATLANNMPGLGESGASSPLRWFPAYWRVWRRTTARLRLR